MKLETFYEIFKSTPKISEESVKNPEKSPENL